jgi:hypothetical protein
MSDEHTNNNSEIVATEPELFPLDEAAITLLADIRNQMRMLEAQSQGALVLFIRQHNLKGNWQMSENGRELVKTPQPVTAPAR